MSDNAFPDALPPQYRLHWYVIERVLGQGGFGITYLARDTNLDQPVAIKEYLPVEVATRRSDATVGARTDEQQERYRWGLERFIREARTLARFDHPNIVRVLSVFELNSTAYMVMRFEEGETLAALLDQRHSLGETDLLRVLLPILDGLELVHNAGFIHRDIKPDNIHIRSDGTPVLLDFGSARYAAGHSRTVTILVAPGYAPFEQYYSSGESQGPWTDIYSLGATCYRAIAGRAPLDAIARSKGILGSTRELLVPASAVGSGRYSERLLKAIDHALAFGEKERPQAIAEWRRELTSAAPNSARTRLAPPPEALPVARPLPPALAGMRAPLVWATAGAVATIVAIALVPWLASGRREPPVPVAVAPIAPAPPAPKDPAIDEEKINQLIAQKLEEQRRQQAMRDEQRTVPQEKKERPRAQEKPARQAKPKAPPIVPKMPAESAPSVLEKPAEKTPEAAALKPEAPAVALAPIAKPPAVVEPPRQASAPPDPLDEAEAAFKASDYARAVALFRPLAERGNAKAQLRMGEFYAKGLGVPQNNFQAYVWYSAAAGSGSAAAKAERQRVDPLLQPAEKLQADKLAERLARAPRER